MLGITIGALSVWNYLEHTRERRSDWFTLVPAPGAFPKEGPTKKDPLDRVSVSFSNEVFQDQDIGLPDIAAVKGQAKFLQSGADPTSHFVPLGYVARVTMKPTDLKALPERYKHNKDLGHGFTRDALENAVFKVNFSFVLLDGDGFELLKVESPTTDIQAGGTSKLQDRTAALIPSELVKKVVNIRYTLNVMKDYSILGSDD